MAPFALVDQFGKTIAYLIYFAIGLGFGATLEMAGFSDSRRLAGQFYLRNLTVLKVMFTAIITAMVLVFLSSALGLLDYPRVYVNPTYLVPGIVGGLVMGVGFILGGFCPGTSLVAVSTLKVDALFFFLGVCIGVFSFGESVGRINEFFYSSSMGRFTLPEWLGAPTGFVVVGVVLMALFMFWGGEKLEAKFGGPEEYAAVRVLPTRIHHLAAASLLGLALVTLVIGQPNAEERWNRAGKETHSMLENRAAYIEPGELLSLSQNRQVRLLMLDVRSEAEYNVFHLEDARRVDMHEVEEGLLSLELLQAPNNTVTVLIANDEVRSTEAWRRLKADRVLNAYILEGGVNDWLEEFRSDLALVRTQSRPVGTMRYPFPAALGAGQAGSNLDELSHEHPDLAFEAKVKLQTKKKLGGGCG
ncbi:MAG: YeeE/YedE family protein [Candidatus Eisenbacteria bacterium]|uniref:YeeE/YedE family protein n=1 Tax=Eiseniibacteriota bacterium TaxID=2212470 RepID=A0A956SCZ3_UNCEI|nr:YeeE/YedE family protein [Candidatus Eisenbacteria bacterium]